nr:RNA-directed DNA polymerase, eukaryota [Tanacetum cinerariifolium]
MGNVKDLISIPTLPFILAKEGFLDVKLSYLGGLWVLLEFNSESIKDKALCHIGVNSWFNALQTATNDFVSDERVVWVDIEGIPMHVWSRDTFIKIGKKWGEVVDMEESHDSSFARKRLCIKTKLSYYILESFKVISRGKVFMVRAKELFTWTPQFRAHKPDEYVSDDEPPIGDTNTHVEPLSSDDEVAGDSDREGVSETNFGDKPLSPPKSLYRPINDRTVDEDPSLSHPYGFTPEVSQQEKYYTSSPIKEKCNDHGDKADRSPIVHPRVMNFSQERNVNESSSGASSIKCPRNTGKGGSILEVLDEMIRVGQSMGYDMEGCSKYIELIIALQETKMENISHMDVKFMWRNSNYHFVSSHSAGNSGGILCVWEDSMFKKDSVLVSNNFIALFGTWLPNNTKVLIVTIYAPQSRILKRSLWEYISLMISRWHGESIVLGDFNEVRTEKERFGSLFNRASARDFNSFISSAGLVEIKSEGCSYTWSHPSATKMSKLDRFLVSEGIISNFSAITAGSMPWWNKLGILSLLAPFLFIFVMESLHISVSKAVNEGVFKGLQIHESVSISYLFYADDAVFIGVWSENNLVNLIRILNCFYLASGLKINFLKSNVLGAEVPYEEVSYGASLIRCDVMCTPFKYLGVMVGDLMTHKSAWASIIQKHQSRLSKWKSKTLSVGGRLTLVKSVLGASPLYHMSIYKAPKGVLNVLESIRSNFFNGIDPLERKITWIAWNKILSSKKKGVSRSSDFKASFCREIRGGVEHQQWTDLLSILGTMTLSPSNGRWIYDLNGDGVFRVKDIRGIIDDLYLPSSNEATRWVKCVPIKINSPEDDRHIFFQCDLAKAVLRQVCRWWDIQWVDIMSFEDWNTWFSSIRLSSNLKQILEGVFYVAWWHIWAFRNNTIFNDPPPRRVVISDDIISQSFMWCSSRLEETASVHIRISSNDTLLLDSNFPQIPKGGGVHIDFLLKFSMQEGICHVKLMERPSFICSYREENSDCVNLGYRRKRLGIIDPVSLSVSLCN